MAELADAPDLGSGVLDVGVRASLSAPNILGCVHIAYSRVWKTVS